MQTMTKLVATFLSLGLGILLLSPPPGICAPQGGQSLEAEIVVDASKPGKEINPLIYGTNTYWTGLMNGFDNWWHTQDPKTVLGQMACGIYKGSDPQVMWSNEQTLVYALVGGKQQVPSLDQLYKWWAKHS